MTQAKLKREAPKNAPTVQEPNARRLGVQKAAETAPRLKISTDGEKGLIEVDHPQQAVGWALLCEALGTCDLDFVDGLIRQLAVPGTEGTEVDERHINFLLAVIKSIAPKDHLEAMLAAQMAVVHVLTLRFAGQLPRAEFIPDRDSLERGINRFTRTFTVQMDALKRHRSPGDQQVILQQNVSVEDGGQAIVGTVNRSASDSPPQSTQELLDARRAPLQLIDEVAHTLVGSS